MRSVPNAHSVIATRDRWRRVGELYSDEPHSLTPTEYDVASCGAAHGGGPIGGT